MEVFLEKALTEKDEVRFKRYKLIKKLLIFAGGENKLEISEEFYLKILTAYLEDDRELIPNQTLIYDLYIFFEHLIDLYLEGKKQKYNFLVDEYEIKSFLKKWLREKKNDIMKFMDFYIGDNLFYNITPLYTNEYFEIVQIISEKNGGGGGYHHILIQKT